MIGLVRRLRCRVNGHAWRWTLVTPENPWWEKVWLFVRCDSCFAATYVPKTTRERP